jgi:hypothetical protein
LLGFFLFALGLVVFVWVCFLTLLFLLFVLWWLGAFWVFLFTNFFSLFGGLFCLGVLGLFCFWCRLFEACGSGCRGSGAAC